MTPLSFARAGAIGSVLTGIGSSFAQSSQYKIQEMQSRTMAKVAKLEGEAQALQLHHRYNKTMASNVVMAAAQGRSGASVEAMAGAARQQFNWDADFTRLAADIEAHGHQSQAAQYGIAAESAMMGGSLSAIQGGLQQYATSLYKIGG